MRRTGRLVVSLAVVAFAAAPARADIGKQLLTGISYALAPNLGQANNGPLATQNIFRQRLIRNFAGDGYGYEFIRTLGTDSYGNANQIEIPGLTAAFQGSIHNRFEINRRFIPELRIQSDTLNAPLQYNITSSPGAQTFTFNGNVAANVTGTINALGFYNLQMGVSNTGTARLDGVAITDQRSTDYDIGPISITGNIFADMGSAILQAATTPLVGGTNPAAIANNVPSAASAKDKQADPAAAVDPASALSDQQVQEALGKALMQAIFAQAISDLAGSELSQLAGLLGLSTEQTIFAYDSSKATASAGAVPEPGTIGLLALPLVFLALRRTR